MIFITGSTGFLGNAVLSRLYTRYPHEKFLVLVRAENKEHARKRIISEFKHLKEFGEETDILKRIVPVQGDLESPSLGISQKDREAIIKETESIYHSAANTHLNLPLDQAKQVNLEGTREVLKLASEIVQCISSELSFSQRRDNFRFNHISTAYVAGDTTDIVSPDMLDVGKKFRNSYEQTKAEAEMLVRSHQDLFNIVVYRPSIIVGDSVTGMTSTFNVLYIPARLVIMGLLKVIPAFPHIPFDVVPVDYVAESIANSHSLRIPSGSAFHLSAGVGRESSPGEVLELLFHAAKSYSSRRIPQKPGFVSPDILQRTINSMTHLASNLCHSSAYKNFEKIVCEHIPVFRQLLPFIPYMISNPRFDTNTTLKNLGCCVQPAPLFSTYAENIFRYCIESSWGKYSWGKAAKAT
ncbi:MAG TPA: SDR family oxidoreductase [Oligoflexia bacterium]|nr:SDR family oxidoreductase [Oligoflexia bacterium]HMP49768.1 SDR family oxidoreductase [Oligoflexia bacterium]